MSTVVTNGYAAKRALMARLAQFSGLPGSAMSGVQVQYALKASVMETVCVYGGTIAFDQPGDDDVEDGTGRAVKEVATIGVHIRVVVKPPTEEGIEATDIKAEEIGDAIAALLAAEPNLAGGKSVTRVAAGIGDYDPNEEQDVSTLSLRVSVESFLG